MPKELLHKIDKLRNRRPLVHCLTNQVTINFVANSLLAFGASPIMSSSPDEAENILNNANSLYLNIGTLSLQSVETMLLAGKIATRRDMPIVLDPVGAGATPLRGEACAKLLNEIKISAIKGNASEILALARKKASGRGVDSAHQVEEARSAADELAKKYNLTVAVTGIIDYVTNGENFYHIKGGHELMARTSGTGCALGGLLAAWLSLPGEPAESTAQLLEIAARCGERAALKAGGPGTFAPLWLDELYLFADNDN